MSGPHGVPARWVVLLAVKPLPLAKSRLARPDRSVLTLAMAADTAAAAAGVPSVVSVLVVTDDDDARLVLTSSAVVVPDTPAAGLNAALEYGADEAGKRWPEAGVVVLAADLPALQPSALAGALDLAARHPRALVADASGTGTVLLSAAQGLALGPSFGPGSRGVHLASGAVDLTGSLEVGPETAGLRQDVDTSADLEIAIGIGVGPATRQVLAPGTPLTFEWQTPAVSNSAGSAAPVRPCS